MTVIAAILIITSAFMHAGWNFVSKRRSPSLAFFFLAALSGALIMSPLLAIYWETLPLVPGPVWALVVLTGVAQLVYFFGLAGAYQRGDISLAYPLARALPVLMVAGVSLLLGKGAEIGRLSLLGMALISVGCVLLPMTTFRQVRPVRDTGSDRERSAGLPPWYARPTAAIYGMAVIAALGTTGYTLFDDQALRHLRHASAIALSNREVTLLFISLQTISTAIMLGMATALYPTERRQLRQHMGNRSFIILASLTGLVVMATYGLVLASMAYVTNVSYVAAFRQLSIPIGALLGFALAREPRYPPKLLGIGIVSFGLVLVAMG